MKKETIIYVCCEPDTNEIRYVGKTVTKLEYRINRHLADKTNTHRGKWFRKVKNPNYFEIDRVPINEDWREYEIFWIAYFKFIGAELVNKTAGGEGFYGYKRTKEHTEKIANSNRGKKRSAEIRKKISNGAKGRIVSAETRLKKSIIGKGRTHTPESKLKMSIIAKGKPKSEETKLKISKTLTGRSTKPCSEETKLKIGKANKKSWDKRKTEKGG